ncbi:MAG: response regulator [Spirochaetes bacterium]|nr:response regulator [Spirochaetota bacterium]
MKGRGEFPSLNTKTPDGIKPGGRPYKVMVVENKDFQRKQLVQFFESESYMVVATASNGQEALDKLSKIEGKIDLITTTLDMPVMDGYAFMHELARRQNRPPVVVFISEETTKGVMADLIKLGVGDYILKPIDRKTVLYRVKAALQKYRLSHPE